MASVNETILIGNLGADPDLRKLPNGQPTATISVATSNKWKDKTGESKEKTEWHRIVFFRGLADVAGKYLKTGSQVYVKGRLSTRKYIDKNGVERFITEIIGREMQMLGLAPDRPVVPSGRPNDDVPPVSAEDFDFDEVP